MQTSAADRSLWLQRRRTTRRAWCGFTLLFASFFTLALWLNGLDYQQWLQQAAQYRQDRRAYPASPDCQTLAVQVRGYREEGDEASEIHHNWLVLQSKSGEKLEAEAQQHFDVGDTVTVIVWNGEVEEISGNGTTTQTEANPILRAKVKRRYFAALWVVSLIWLWLIVPLTFIGADKLHEKQWRNDAGNKASE